MKSYIQSLIDGALTNWAELTETPDYIIEQPKVAEHGDLSTNVAMMLSKSLKKNPRQVAQELVSRFTINPKYISKVDIAGPGFINFKLTDAWVQDQLLEILQKGDQFGKTTLHKGKKVLVEFVSANPTGPLTVGHGRNAVLGDTISRLFEWSGAEVTREYYFNNAGRQMRVLGESVKARYGQLLGKDTPLPEGGYEGEYIRDIGQEVINDHGDSKLSADYSIFKEYAERTIFSDIQKTMKRLSINMDTFFNENSLYEDGSIEETTQRLRDKNLAYDKDGAVWFKTTEFGKEKDTVLIKSTGEPTYRLPDIAYHVKKLERGFDICVDIFGADHIATFPDVLSGVSALGFDPKKVEVLIYQFVTIVKDGKPFKMSTRKANYITLDELMDEVGEDVTRFFFLMRAPSTHLEFDIDEAKESSEKNPVFYLQYAHARIKSILRKAAEEYSFTGNLNVALLVHESEIALIKELLNFPDALVLGCKTKEPQKVITYLESVSSAFTRFYHDCRVIGVDADLALARKELLVATAQVIKNALGVLGISAPDQM